MTKAWNAVPYLPYSILWTVLFIAHAQLAADHGNFSVYLIAGGLVPLLIIALIRRNRPTFQNLPPHRHRPPLRRLPSSPTPSSYAKAPPDSTTDAAGSSTPC